MNFWEINKDYYDRTALLDPENNVSVTYADVDSITSGIAETLYQPKKLAFLFCKNDYISIIYYISLLKAGHAVLLLDAKLNDEIRSHIISLYNPSYILGPADMLFKGYIKYELAEGYNVNQLNSEAGYTVHKDLGVLLSTSGTTGSPKLVRLSYSNVQANAESITDYLSIDKNERAITSLPMSYSFGLSVINTHLLTGGSLLLTDKSFIFRDFWNMLNEYKCTSFAGVPYSYELLKKINFANMDLPSLKTMTQAGGRLNVELIKYYTALSHEKNFRFFVMYGQTEATARISYVPPDMLPSKTGSIGISIPGGEIRIFSEGEEVHEPGIQGELIYEGKNVMMGYAELSDDLEKGDETKGILRTGDIAYKDKDGFFYITGRLKRFIKIFGLRLNLDEVEKMIESHYCIFNACSGTDDKLNILLDTADSAAVDEIRIRVAAYYKINISLITVRMADKMPVTESGKKDYAAIARMF